MKSFFTPVNWTEFDRLFDQFYQDYLPTKKGEILKNQYDSTWKPETDIYETSTSYEVEMEIPGIEQKSIELSFNDGVLCIKGEKDPVGGSDQSTQHWEERRYGVFERNFRLGDKIDVNNIDAQFKDGLLKISLQKLPEVQPKVIEIKG